MGYYSEPAEITVDYETLKGFPKEFFDEDKVRVQTKLKCAYVDRFTLAKQLLGYIEDKGSDIVRHLPTFYNSSYTVFDKCIAVSVDIAPYAGSPPNYEFAELDVIYETPDYDLPEEGEETYITESLEPAAEFLTLAPPDEAKINFFWAQGGAEEDRLKATEMPGRLIRMVDWVYTLNKMSSLPDVVFTLPGKVNSSSVYSKKLKRTFPAETLLCGNPSLRREYTSEGISKWTVTFRLTYRNNALEGQEMSSPKGWNHFPDVRTAGSNLNFVRLYDENDDVRYIYPKASFAGLIQP